MSALLSVDITTEHSTTRIMAVGELDVSTVEQLRETLNFNDDPGTGIELDLGGLTFMDSSGIRLLVEADLAARENGHTFAITRPSRQVRRILEAVGIWDDLPTVRHLKSV
jgi:anti-sigma B factor antagonist